MERTLPWSLWREHSPDDTCISDFWPPELGSRALALGLLHGGARCIEEEEEHFPHCCWAQFTRKGLIWMRQVA